jgi:hypothetical protein
VGRDATNGAARSSSAAILPQSGTGNIWLQAGPYSKPFCGSPEYGVVSGFTFSWAAPRASLLLLPLPAAE